MKNSDYLKNTRKKINRLLKKPAGKFVDEDYHKLRVEIKKLKSVAGFIEFSNKHFSGKKQLKPFSKIYEQAGKIRELQLQQAFLEKQDHFAIENYLGNLLKKIQKQKKKFDSILSAERRKKINKSIRQTAKFLKHINEIDAIGFTNNEKRKIASLIQELPLKKEKAHELRKILKEDFYNRKRTNWPSRKIKEEDDLLRLLGSWHDSVVLNDQLKKAISKMKNKREEAAALQKIKRSVSSQSEKLFNQINLTLAKGVFNLN